MVVVGFVVVVLVLGASVAFRFGLFAHPAKPALERLAAHRGYRLAEDGLDATVGGTDVHVDWHFAPGHGGRVTSVRATGTDGRHLQGWVATRPRTERERAGLRTGDLDFDERFFVEGSSRADACAVLEPRVRLALFAFGPAGGFRYEDGRATLAWDDDAVDPERVERAIAVVAAACRAQTGGYRD